MAPAVVAQPLPVPVVLVLPRRRPAAGLLSAATTAPLDQVPAQTATVVVGRRPQPAAQQAPAVVPTESPARLLPAVSVALGATTTQQVAVVAPVAPMAVAVVLEQATPRRVRPVVVVVVQPPPSIRRVPPGSPMPAAPQAVLAHRPDRAEPSPHSPGMSTACPSSLLPLRPTCPARRSPR